MLVNFFFKRPHNKYFRLCRPHRITVAYSFFFFTTLNQCKTILGSQAVYTKTSGSWIWPAGSSLQIPEVGSLYTDKPFVYYQVNIYVEHWFSNFLISKFISQYIK